MIKIGKNNLFKAYLGQKQIKKIYFGKELIYQAPSEGLAYTYNEEYDGYFVRITENCKDTYIIIPEYFYTEDNGWNDVVGIDGEFFTNAPTNIKFEAIQIPNSIKKIGYLREVPSQINVVFQGTLDQWAQIDFTKSNKLFDDGGLFYLHTLHKDNIVTSIKFKDGLTKINPYAFAHCDSLTSIEIPDSVISIGEHAFYRCDNLTEIYINQKASNNYMIDKSAFDIYNPINIYYNQSANEFFKTNFSDEGSAFSSQGYRLYTFSEQTNQYNEVINIDFNSRDSSISSYKFSNILSLEQLSITSNNDAVLKPNCIIDCPNLKDLVIGDGITQYVCTYKTDECIGPITDCDNLENITLPFVGLRSSANSKIDGVFGSIFGWVTSTNPQDHRLSNTIIQYQSTRMNSIIDYYGYKIPKNIKNVTIINQEHLPTNAFCNCSMITNITLPENLKTIHNLAFYECKDLITTFTGSVNQWAQIKFEDNPIEYSSKFYVGTSILSQIDWSNESIEVSRGAFYKCSSLTKVIIGKNIKFKEIDTDNQFSKQYSAFEGCSNILSITVPTDLFADSGLSKLNPKDLHLTFGNQPIELSQAFFHSNLLTLSIANDSVSKIAISTFKNCSKLQNLTLPFVGSIKNNSGNSHFGYIFGATSSQDNDDYIPSSLTNLTITGGNIYNQAFAYIYQTVNIYLNGVTRIESNAFLDAVGLSFIRLSKSIQYIGAKAFSGCSSLYTLRYDGTIEDWFNLEKDDNWLLGSQISSVICNYNVAGDSGDSPTAILKISKSTIINASTTIIAFNLLNIPKTITATIKDDVESGYIISNDVDIKDASGNDVTDLFSIDILINSQNQRSGTFTIKLNSPRDYFTENHQGATYTLNLKYDYIN